MKELILISANLPWWNICLETIGNTLLCFALNYCADSYLFCNHIKCICTCAFTLYLNSKMNERNSECASLIEELTEIWNQNWENAESHWNVDTFEKHIVQNSSEEPRKLWQLPILWKGEVLLNYMTLLSLSLTLQLHARVKNVCTFTALPPLHSFIARERTEGSG
jgi:hypothetical protein